jgi:hypothetical protein
MRLFCQRPRKSETYAVHPIALQLRAMNIIYETTKERGATILMPSAMIDSLNPAAALTVALVLKGPPASLDRLDLPGGTLLAISAAAEASFGAHES